MKISYCQIIILAALCYLNYIAHIIGIMTSHFVWYAKSFGVDVIILISEKGDLACTPNGRLIFLD